MALVPLGPGKGANTHTPWGGIPLSGPEGGPHAASESEKQS